MTLTSKQRILILTAMVLGLVAYAFALSRPAGRVDAASDTACVLPDVGGSSGSSTGSSTSSTSSSSTTKKVIVRKSLVNADHNLNNNSVLNNNNVEVLNDVLDVNATVGNIDIVDDVTTTVDAVVGDVL